MQYEASSNPQSLFPNPCYLVKLWYTTNSTDWSVEMSGLCSPIFLPTTRSS